MTAVLIIASARDQIADYVDALVQVYTVLILAYILTQLYFSFGGRIPYARWSSGLIGFLRDVVEPYLSIFRRFIPPLGPLDISPILAIILLQVVRALVVGALRG